MPLSILLATEAYPPPDKEFDQIVKYGPGLRKAGKICRESLDQTVRKDILPHSSIHSGIINGGEALGIEVFLHWWLSEHHQEAPSERSQ